ncbi:putative transporter [Psilocybe cubensis]|uniref:Transporter n=1 Tax=Psilocybe cubensis TaxID=181762 RepID=A0ACB8H4Q9_PSICU|nr:putative transporter [Psilocybe cubensis]KAH9482627.1 putative transporter [Psilocybe cubensis]
MTSINSEISVNHQKTLTKKVLWKLDCHILPPLALLWLANFIDRSNVGNARIAGLEKDTHLKGNQFNTVLAVFYVSYLLVELPSNMLLKKMKPNRWIPLLVCLWGVITTLSALGLLKEVCSQESFVLDPLLEHHLQTSRATAKDISHRVASLSGAFGGLLATAILKMDGVGGLAGWRWIFILEGLATVISSFIAAYFLPESLETASFFTDEERKFASKVFRHSKLSSGNLCYVCPNIETFSPIRKDLEEKANTEGQFESTSSSLPAQNEEEFEWREVFRGIWEIQVWLTGLAYFGLIVSLYSYSLFLPTIVAGLGYTGSEAQLHTGE